MLVGYGEIFHLLEDKALVAGHTRWLACCIYMRDHGETEAFEWALTRLGMHPGMRSPIEEINQRYQRLGASAYTYYFPGQ